MLDALILSLAVSAAPAVSPSTPGYVFVTQQSGSGNLSTWVEAAGQSGLAAGDAICKAEAANAQLDSAQSYIAFLSDSQNDLYCRLHGLTGTKANNCGLASLPTYAGPWLRRDNIPFATLATLLDDNSAIMPVLFTAAGVDKTVLAAFTGTAGDLTANMTCSDWTSTSGNSRVAFADTISMFNSGSDCLIPRALLCLKPGANAPISFARRSGRLSFATAEVGTGDLSTWPNANGATGIAAGDQVCQIEAAVAHLPEPQSFKAWLSDSTQSINAIDRFQNDGPWVREDGLPVAASKAALTNVPSVKSLPVRVATTLVADSSMMTGTLNSGLAIANRSCNGWTSAASSDMFGSGFGQVIGEWSQFGSPNCNANFYALYCFSDLDRIFDGGMEPIPY